MTWETVAELKVSGEPIAQPRPRAFVGTNGKAAVYDKGKASPWRDRVHVAASIGEVPKGLTGPIRLGLLFELPRPKRLRKGTSPCGLVPHTNVPDIDNLAKAVMDALSVYGVWKDDRQVHALFASKWYVGMSTTEGVTIKIERLASAEGAA